jgi:two-component system LytT family sensor kinase
VRHGTQVATHPSPAPTPTGPTFRTLHTAALASPALREGLTAASAERSIRHLHDCSAPRRWRSPTPRVRLAWHGTWQHHEHQCAALARATVERGSTRMFDRGDLAVRPARCDLRIAIGTPLVVEERVVGTLQVFAGVPHRRAGPRRRRGRPLVSGQLELAELDASRTG